LTEGFAQGRLVFNILPNMSRVLLHN
jgi:hypothetical protein